MNPNPGAMIRRPARHCSRALFALALLATATAAATRPAPAHHASATHAHKHAGAAPRAKPAAHPPANVEDEAVAARLHEDEGAFGMAMNQLRALRARTAADADLELWLAIDEARCGYPDSAWARLAGPLLTAAMADTAPPARWHEYGARRALQWIDGRFTGWHWYVAHARAEVALQLGDWNAALAAARIAANAQPLVGREHLLLAIAAGKAGENATARREAALAAALDPLLPEARYLCGVWAWRDGDRAAARAAFESAIAADSSYREPTLALIRMRLPAMRPDSLPADYLAGIRRIAMITAPDRPKPEEDTPSDTPAGLYGTAPSLVVPDSLRDRMQMTKPVKFYVTVLVDEAGRPALSYLPYLSPEQMPYPILQQVLASAAGWHFRPATRFGHPVRAWISVEYMLYPHS